MLCLKLINLQKNLFAAPNHSVRSSIIPSVTALNAIFITFFALVAFIQ